MGSDSSALRMKQMHIKAYEKYIRQWLNGEVSGHRSLTTFALSNHVRRYMMTLADYACQNCGFNTPHPADGHSILEIHHIDGDASHTVPENLAVLCPNCHALTDSYRARNKGSGRRR